MADTLPQHYTTEFSTNWIQRAQQTKARLDAFVEDESFMGERKRFDRLASVASRKRTERKGPTVVTEVGDDLRWAFRESFELVNQLDRDDAANLGQLVLPSSDYVRGHANAYARDCDDMAVKWARADVYTGEAGTTPTALPSAQKIAHGSTGLTIAKLLTAREILDTADMDDEAPRVLVCHPKQITDLLNTTEVKSADYNTVKALAAGQIDTFMGFKFIRNIRLEKASTTRYCVAWVKGSIKRIKGAMSSKIDILPTQSHTTQIASYWHLGGTRIHDEGVVEIACTES